jgi:choline dehydrogenase-like flavoprotein
LPIQAPCDGTSRDEIDIAIIGSGMGGATFAAGLAPSGARIVILERGERAIFQRGMFRPKEQWFDAAGAAFNPGNYYYVGGNAKFYRAVLILYRAQDFRPIQYAEGATPGWPFDYDEIEPWCARAEALYRVRGKPGDDPTEPRHSAPYEYPPVPDEPAIADVRERLARARTPWDAFPDTATGKMDAESCALGAALAHDNVTLETAARVVRLEADSSGKRIVAIVYEKAGESHRISPRLAVLSAGAVNSALLLLASAIGDADGARQSRRSGRAPFHESQFVGRAGYTSAPLQRFDLPEDDWAERLLSQPRPRRSAAGQRSIARENLRRDSEIAIAPGALIRAGDYGSPRDRFLSYERGSAVSRQPRPA